MKRPVGFLALTFLSSAAVAQPPTTEAAWHCRYSESILCNPGRPCASQRSTNATILYPTQNVVMRCHADMTDCHQYNAHFSNGDTSVLFDVPGWNFMGTLTADLRITDAVAVGHAVRVERGRCEAGPPPVIMLPQQR